MHKGTCNNAAESKGETKGLEIQFYTLRKEFRYNDINVYLERTVLSFLIRSFSKWTNQHFAKFDHG
jgi:hypothetical protein